MNGAIYLNYSGIVYTILLMLCFFLKPKVNNEEQKIYGYLIIVSFLELVLGVFATFSIYLELSMFWILLSNKIYLICVSLWILIFTYYSAFITIKDKIKIIKNYRRILIFVSIIMNLLILLLPLNITFENGNITTVGLAIDLSYLITIFCIISCILFCIIGLKNINKKYIPLYVFLIFGTVCMVIQMLNPEMFLIVPLEVFVTSVMYHTIENPDVKMIEQLNIAKEQADKANRAKTDFLSSMSHEIRTPLNAIVGFSECIVQAESIDEAKENAADIVSASQTLLEIVNGILDISKIEAGKIEIHNSSYNSKELFDGIIKLAKGRLGDKELDFRINIAEDIPETLYGDHANLKKVIINLLTNSIKYTDHGFFELKINCVKTDDICRLMISVEDSGRGIKKEDIDKLFTKFQRLDEDRNTTIEGTGLGLAITKQLIELMGGKIVVQSTFGEGSKFSVALDQKIMATQVEQQVYVEEELYLTGRSILVVDDNKLNLKVASKLLNKYNLNIDTAESGMECLDKINNGNNYDLIFMDDMMPRMNGGETLLRLKKIENFNTPVVALTANAISGMEQKYLDQGFDGYLSKPIEREKLHNLLANFMLKDNSVQEQKVVTEPVKEPVVSLEPVQPVTPVTPVENVQSVPVNVEQVTSQPVQTEQTSELDLTGKNILVVDDNALNIKVASKFIGVFNPTIDSCMSGQECLDKINSGNKYDLIFMDDMMPNMSGVETLHKLKEINGFNIPVVILTANAIEGMKENYLKEGFNDYLSKPIDKKELNRILSTLLSGPYKEKVETPTQFSSVYVTKSNAKNVDFLKNNGIDVDTGINLVGDIEIYNEMMEDFYNNIGNRVNKLNSYKNTQDMANYAIEVHALKSDSKYLGFTTLANIAYNHEMASKQNNIMFVYNNYEELGNELKRIVIAIKEYLDKN